LYTTKETLKSLWNNRKILSNHLTGD
jgi:hypothetical protein